jgi:hypothetical protein
LSTEKFLRDQIKPRKSEQVRKMDSEKIQIPQLDSKNYSIWKIQMRLFLTHKGLDQMIEKKSRTPEELSARRAADVAKDESCTEKSSSSDWSEGEARIP